MTQPRRPPARQVRRTRPANDEEDARMMVATDPMHQFKISKLFEIKLGGYDLSFTNSSLWMVVAVLFIIGFLAWAMSKPQTVPSRKQSLAEIWYGFVAGIVRDVNHDAGKPFIPLLFTMFSFILVANFLGMNPYGFTTTSHIAVTGALAIFTIGLVIIVGLMKKGLGFFSIFVPSGVPLPLLFIVTPIEIISFLSRPLSLAMRLFANMLGGHVALKVFAGFIPSLVTALGALGAGMAAVLVLPMVLGVTALEFLVAFLQAYVFAMLTCVYLNDALADGH
jgi:F-type H+-transporting ATPase subunit a